MENNDQEVYKYPDIQDSEPAPFEGGRVGVVLFSVCHCYNHPVGLIDKLAEEKIAEAIRRGELDNLPGAGKPLHLDEDGLVPEELRAGFRLLKNAGYLAPGLQLRKEIESVEVLLVQARSLEERGGMNKRLRYLLLKLSVAGSD